MLVENLIPRIVSYWPNEEYGKTIRIQQDNARTHVSPDDFELSSVFERLRCHGWDMAFANQPPNSPDTNVCDLGFFAAIQSLQQVHRMKNLTDLVTAVNEAFEVYPWQKLEFNFQSLQACMEEILKNGGGNRYKLPHLHKEKLLRDGRLMENRVCDRTVYTETLEALTSVDRMALAKRAADEAVLQRHVDELGDLFEEIVMVGEDQETSGYQELLLSECNVE
ncbi:hypothetical protein LEN26_009889 [Aphanomyces euteiches]|nr:hypothetical protein LEN26_009889 [Aphanomyces euteiches]